MTVMDSKGNFQFKIEKSQILINVAGRMGVGCLPEEKLLNITEYKNKMEIGGKVPTDNKIINEYWIAFESSKSVDVWIEKLKELKDEMENNELSR